MKKGWILLALVVLVAKTCSSQDSTQAPKRWQFLVEPYLMFPTMSGTIGIGTLPDADFKLGTSDIFSRLQSGFMLSVEAQNGTWAVSSDVLYMKLKQDVEPTKVINSGSATMSETAWELAGLHTLLPWLEGGIALRLLSIQMSAEVVRNQVGGTTSSQSQSIKNTWVDPVLVMRMKLPDSGKWLLQFRGDIGGFSIGSKLTWQLQAYGGYRFSDLFQVTAGYRTLSIDFEKGSDKDRFLYDVITYGPVIRVGFNF